MPSAGNLPNHQQMQAQVVNVRKYSFELFSGSATTAAATAASASGICSYDDSALSARNDQSALRYQ